MDVVLAAGLRTVTWSSLNVDSFFQNISAALAEFQSLNKKARIMCGLYSPVCMATHQRYKTCMNVASHPSSKPCRRHYFWSCHLELLGLRTPSYPMQRSGLLVYKHLKLLSLLQTQCQAGQEVLRVCSGKVEEAVKELISLLRQTAVLPEVLQSESEETAKSKSGM